MSYRFGLRFGAAALWLLAAMPAIAHDYVRFESDGARIAYTDYGSGAPVIFLHALNGDFQNSLQLAGDRIAKDFRVIGVDQRGFGRSDRPHDADAYGQHMARDVLNLMDHLQIHQAHLVGHSMGGVVVMYLIATHPERFHSAVTIGNGLFTQRELQLIGWLIKGADAWARVKMFFGAADALPAGSDRVASVLAARNLQDLAITETQAAAIKLPLLAMRGGENDDPRNTVERLAAVNPAVKMIRIESEDHVSMLSNEKLLQELPAFLLQQSTPVSALPAASQLKP
jgi:pimeloyl-ACP methyl ester carboxylesterase